MSPHRVANQTTARQFLFDSSSTQEALARTQRQITTGHRILTASDDPTGTAQTISYDNQLANVQKYQRTVQDTQGMLNTTDAALQDTASAVTRVRDIVTQAANGTYNGQDRAGMVAELSQIKESIFSLANTQYAGNYVFSGTATSTAPYASPANTYLGNNVTIDKVVSNGPAVPSSLIGSTIFGTTGPGPGVLNTIDQIIADLTANTPASIANLNADKTQLDADFTGIQQQQANIGALQNRFENQLSQLQATEETLTQARSTVYDADTAKTYVQMQSQNQMYQAALAAGSQMMKTSLLNFI